MIHKRKSKIYYHLFDPIAKHFKTLFNLNFKKSQQDMKEEFLNEKKSIKDFIQLLNHRIQNYKKKTKNSNYSFR
jgi:hypothetical protein